MHFDSLLSMAGAVLSGIGVLLLFSLAVFIHELGHFLAARWMGLTIDAFSIGFGPAIWKRKVGETEYRVGTIPFGGYVALPQLDPSGMSTIQGEHGGGAVPAAAPASEVPPAGSESPRLLKDVAPWRRIVVAVTGPAGNIILAVALAWIIFLAPPSGQGPAEATVGTVDGDSASYAAGLRVGDRIASVNGNAVHNWNEFLVESHLGGDASNGLPVVVYRDGAPLDLRLPVVHDATARLVRVEGIGPRLSCVVGGLITNSPAARAGVRPGDVIQTLDGAPVASPDAMMRQVDAHGARPLAVGIRRGDHDFALVMTPRYNAEVGRHLIGIEFGGRVGLGNQWLQYRKPWLQLKSDATSVVRILRALVAPQTKGESKRAASSLSGPLVIVVLLWLQVRDSLIAALAFMRFLCVNLALLNLLPLPVLDGGHIVFALYETITRRKPNARLVNVLSNAFAVLLIGLMVLLLFRDVGFLRRFFGADRAPAHERAAPADGSTPVPANAVDPRNEAP